MSVEYYFSNCRRDDGGCGHINFWKTRPTRLICQKCGESKGFIELRYRCGNCGNHNDVNTQCSCGFKEGRSAGSGGCYITTATLFSLGKSDERCYELETFRNFRDTYVQKNFPELINKYYISAPNIVSQINSLSNNHSIYKKIWNDYLANCLKYIENKENEKATTLYVRMMNYLSIEFYNPKN